MNYTQTPSHTRNARFVLSLLSLPFAICHLGAATITTNLTLSEANLTYEGQDIVVSGATLTLDGPHAFNSLFLTNGAVLTHSPCTTTNTHKLDLIVTNTIAVSSNSRISVSGQGYQAGLSSGNTTTNASTGWSGGSFGGLGGNSGGGVACVAYGSYLDPNNWGSGGAATGGASSGGGLVRLVADSLSLQGNLTANGAGASVAAGAGGGICVRVNTLTGSGNIQAKGGNSALSYGGGGGGRIAVYAGDFGGFTLTNITAAGGTGNLPGGAGTIYLRNPNQPAGTLIVSTAGATNAAATPIGLPDARKMALDALVLQGGASARPEHAGMDVTCAGELRVEGSSKLLGLDGVWAVAGPVTVGSNSVLEVWDSLSTPSDMVVVQGGALYGGWIEAATLTVSNGTISSFAATTNQTYKLEFDIAGAIVINSNSIINLSGLGYLAGRTTGNTTTNASTVTSGGSFGGLGGNYGGLACAVYGNQFDPDDWGSGGSSGNGGGLVRLVADSLTLGGSLWANGSDAYYGAGSGGGIFVLANTLTGLGSMGAIGGSATYASGGGGRIAVYAADYSGFFTNHLSVAGGSGGQVGRPRPDGARSTEEYSVRRVEESGGHVDLLALGRSDLGHRDLQIGGGGGRLEGQVEAGRADDGQVLGERRGLEGEAVSRRDDGPVVVGLGHPDVAANEAGSWPVLRGGCECDDPGSRIGSTE